MAHVRPDARGQVARPMGPGPRSPGARPQGAWPQVARPQGQACRSGWRSQGHVPLAPGHMPLAPGHVAPGASVPGPWGQEEMRARVGQGPCARAPRAWRLARKPMPLANLREDRGPQGDLGSTYGSISAAWGRFGQAKAPRGQVASLTATVASLKSNVGQLAGGEGPADWQAGNGSPGIWPGVPADEKLGFGATGPVRACGADVSEANGKAGPCQTGTQDALL